MHVASCLECNFLILIILARMHKKLSKNEVSDRSEI